MLIERQTEQTLKTHISSALSSDNVEIVGSWEPSNSGYVKGEGDKDAKAVVSLYVEPRKHDSFSLPTVNLNGTVAIDCRAEMCPTMKEVSEIYEKVLNVFDTWHYDASAFSEDVSTDDFYATEIMLNGGDKVEYDKSNFIWTVTFDFTIRGTVIY